MIDGHVHYYRLCLEKRATRVSSTTCKGGNTVLWMAYHRYGDEKQSKIRFHYGLCEKNVIRTPYSIKKCAKILTLQKKPINIRQRHLFINPSKPTGSLFNIKTLCTQFTQNNQRLFPCTTQLIGFCNRDGGCLPRGMNWLLKWKDYVLSLKGLNLMQLHVSALFSHPHAAEYHTKKIDSYIRRIIKNYDCIKRVLCLATLHT